MVLPGTRLLNVFKSPYGPFLASPSTIMVKTQSVVMGKNNKMDGENRRGRPYRKWIDDIKEWCQKDSRTNIKHVLIRIAQDLNKWRQAVKCSLDTYGLSAHRS